MRHSSSVCKPTYSGDHAYLKMDHSYCRKNSHFHGHEENCEAPLIIISEYIIENEHKKMLFIECTGICGS